MRERERREEEEEKRANKQKRNLLIAPFSNQNRTKQIMKKKIQFRRKIRRRNEK